MVECQVPETEDQAKVQSLIRQATRALQDLETKAGEEDLLFFMTQQNYEYNALMTKFLEKLEALARHWNLI